MNKTKKISLVLLVLSAIIIAGAASFVYGAISEFPKLEVTLISQDPDPAEPGQILELRFKVENRGSQNAEDITFEILPEYPFSLYSGIAAKKIGSIQGWQKQEQGVIVYYKLKVDDDAVQGENTIDIKYKIGKGDWIYVKDFIIRIRTADVVLAITSVVSYPEVIPAGSKAKIKFRLKNLADSLIRDIKIRLDLSSSDVPFVPIKSTTEKKIYQLISKRETELTFDVMAMPDAESKAYKIPVNISYMDEVGTSYSRNDIIGLIIGDVPDLAVSIESSEIYKEKTSGKVTIKFVNKGLTDIKLMNVELKQSEDYEIVSPEEVYVGNIDSDDYETAEFDIYLIKDRNEVILPLTLEYMDANNKEYTQLKNLQLKLYSETKARKYGISKERGIGTLIIIVIVVGGLGIYIWRQKKKGKKILKRW